MQLPIISKLFKSSKPKNILALHLGSSEILAAVCSLPKNEERKVEILGLGKQEQGKSAMQGKKILDLDGVLETADLAIQRAYLSAGIKPKETIFCLSSGTILGKGLTVRLNRPQPERPISQKELTAILSKIREQTSDKVVETGSLQKILELSVTQYKLDGKKVAFPLDLPGKTLEASILHTFAEVKDIETLNVVASELDLKVRTFVETSLVVANSLLTKHESGILLLVENDATELTIFRNGKIYGNKTYNLDENSPFWTKGLEVCLSEFEEVKPLPSQFFVLGKKDLKESLRFKLESEILKNLPFADLPKIETLEEQEMLKALSLKLD